MSSDIHTLATAPATGAAPMPHERHRVIVTRPANVRGWLAERSAPAREAA